MVCVYVYVYVYVYMYVYVYVYTYVVAWLRSTYDHHRSIPILLRYYYARIPLLRATSYTTLSYRMN